jgi:hypothetical protein
MPSGHNGPWNDQDTPVRNTANWLKTFLFVYNKTKDKRFLFASEKALNYLLSGKARPFNATFYCRNGNNKNKTNGLIGQAWTLEALIDYYNFSRNYKILNIIEDIFLLHKFDYENGLWYEMNLDGSVNQFCRTYNQQLWFATIASEISPLPKKIRKKINIFINNLEKNTHIYINGLIKHRFPPKNDNFFKKAKRRREEKELSIGYHSFNLYAFAILKKRYPDHFFWKSKKFQKILEYTQSLNYKKNLVYNKYSFSYNVTGVEVALALNTFKEGKKNLEQEWLEKQFRNHYNIETNLMELNTSDPETLSARIYEAKRMPNLNIYL